MPAVKKPWYRQPWVWLLIAFPLSAVIGGMITLYLAVTTSDGLVVDDYYRKGKAINRELVRDRVAAAYGLRAHVSLDADSEAISVALEADGYDFPGRIQLSLLHPTRAGSDQVLTLARAPDGRYLGHAVTTGSSSWHVLVEADDWRLTGRLSVPQPEPALLVPLADVPGPVKGNHRQ